MKKKVISFELATIQTQPINDSKNLNQLNNKIFALQSFHVNIYISQKKIRIIDKNNPAHQFEHMFDFQILFLQNIALEYADFNLIRETCYFFLLLINCVLRM